MRLDNRLLPCLTKRDDYDSSRVTVPTHRPGPDAKLRRATFRQRERLEDPRELPFRRVIGWCLIPVNHKRRLNSRSVTGVPISSARYRIGPTSASARWRWASILAFSICRLASACASRWRSANDIGALAAFLVSDRHAPSGRPCRVDSPTAASIWAMRRSRSATVWPWMARRASVSAVLSASAGSTVAI